MWGKSVHVSALRTLDIAAQRRKGLKKVRVFTTGPEEETAMSSFISGV